MYLEKEKKILSSNNNPKRKEIERRKEKVREITEL